MADVIVETPVTGLPGRTPRENIEAPVTERELEPVFILDISGSNNEQAAPDSPTTKAQLWQQVIPLIVGQLEKDDAQAASEQAGGEEGKGGLRTFTFNEPGPIQFDKDEDESDDYRDHGDLNSANVQAQLATIRWEGRTYIMPAIRAAETAFQAEFGNDASPHYKPLRSRPALEILVGTDGMISDAAEFENWLAQADETCVIAVAVVGYGPGHDQAVEHYKALAAKNKYLTYVALTGVSDPMEVAFDLRVLAGTSS